MQKRVGILGGTFNPIHNGHLLIAEQAREQAELDEVWFMPAHIPPHKESAHLISSTHRLQMVDLAISDHPAFFSLDVELKREGRSYTIDTMEELTSTYPGYAFFFIVGGDMLQILPKWHRFADLTKLVHFIGFARPGTDYDEQLLKPFVTFVDVPNWDISSTDIREKANKSRSLRYLVPPVVECYLKEHKLYE
ncbi:nicotinate-nucleotide adenylyltransferase [Brevibacillus ginsengisoli]|uniref:nicotinate-nucleotide adenylyltransferase n=1 Tax=Brevibacillus ginsengisoli TaxID=363854 RepID=UPI003CFB9B6C